ncbi:lycopene beta-cyclase CrtY [Novosphingobium sp. 9]|uniref:lycopene beta-cyclase CrtY n=1 Tax=Novosphingobium sp. 9 TaxID=2025349 RepID=UPI0021B4FD68|nr:lycopene beta-cyclase CrtY [Novosphingobium sp. 9]
MNEGTGLIVVGGGLSGGLIALAMAARRPDIPVTLLERGETLGGEHVWSFFGSDIAPANRDWIEPLIVARWEGYDVHFPAHSRQLHTAYHAVTSARLDAAVRAALPADRILTGVEVDTITPQTVTLHDGRVLRAHAVIDARGAGALPHMAGGWQKFMGQTLHLSHPHGLTRPVVMDARVEQLDGYRFVYCLPFGERDVFVEDTYYSDSPDLDPPALRDRIARYAQRQGWPVARIGYEETGVLPVIAKGDFPAFWHALDEHGTARAGVRAGLAHPLTSYSFPQAVMFATYLTTLDNPDGMALGRFSHAWSHRNWRRGGFYRMLTRMLFAAARPDARYRMLERFYRLPESLIERFYAGASTPADMVRVLSGRPPVPVIAAAASLLGGGAPLADLGMPGLRTPDLCTLSPKVPR